jgi:hypothetical protein
MQVMKNSVEQRSRASQRSSGPARIDVAGLKKPVGEASKEAVKELAPFWHMSDT